MKKETLKNLTHAHAWLGLIISGVLMVVFVCGTASFYRSNIIAWDKHYNPDKQLEGELAGVPAVVERLQQKGFKVPLDHQVFVSLPNQDSPQYSLYFEVEQANGEHEDMDLHFHGNSLKESTASFEQYYLGNMLYRMHINLLIPYGRELVGIVYLLFLVLNN